MAVETAIKSLSNKAQQALCKLIRDKQLSARLLVSISFAINDLLFVTPAGH